MMCAFVWTLPVQKLFLLAGLAWKYGDKLQPVDVLACLPEAMMAGLLTRSYLHWRHQQWRRLAVNLLATFLTCSSWIVIALWLATGAVVSFQLLLQFISEPAIRHTSLASPYVGYSLFFAAVTLCALWGGVALCYRWFARVDFSLSDNGRSLPLALIVGIALWHGLPVSSASPTFQLALLTPLSQESLMPDQPPSDIDPEALAELLPRQQQKTDSASSPPAHVVLLVLESLRYQPASLFETGFPTAFHFDRFYAHYPHSVKTLEALLFGIYPSPTQVSASWSIDKYAIEHLAPLPRILQSRGYATTYYAAMDLSYDNYGNTLRAAGMEHTELVRSDRPLTWGQSDATTLLGRVADTLEAGAQAGQSQFVMAWTAECHMPYDYAEEQQPAPVSLQRYQACSAALARTVDDFIHRLSQSGRLNDTLVIVLGDHGEIFPEEKAGEVGHGQHVYEPSLHSSLLVFFPQRQSEKRDQRLFQPVDIPATILSALHIPLPSSWVGRDIFAPAEPGRAFVVCRSMLANGAVAIIDKSGGKYVRNRQGQAPMFYDLNTDPLEQSPYPVSDHTASVIEQRIATYTALSTQTWNSYRLRATTAEHEFPGSAVAHWTKGYCITVTPNYSDGTATIAPTDSPECKDSVGPAGKHLFRVFPRSPFMSGVRIEFDIKLDSKEILQEKPLRAWAKTSVMNDPLAVDIKPLFDTWQTVTLTLPSIDPSADPIGSRQQADVIIMVAPVDWPLRYTLKTVKVEPLRRDMHERLRMLIAQFW
jgi:hypothetical protein